jgi:hypothetical protein
MYSTQYENVEITSPIRFEAERGFGKVDFLIIKAGFLRRKHNSISPIRFEVETGFVKARPSKPRPSRPRRPRKETLVPISFLLKLRVGSSETDHTEKGGARVL